MKDDEITKILQLGRTDEVDLWSKVRQEMPVRTSLFEYFVPVAAAILAVLIVHGSFKVEAPSNNWPVRMIQLPQATVRAP